MTVQNYIATYSLDKESMEQIDYLALFWKVPKAEVIRRCIRQEIERLVHRLSPLDVLLALEKKPVLQLDEKTWLIWQAESQSLRAEWG